MISFLFKGATVVDGTGAAPFLSDVAIAAGKIAAIAPRIDTPATEVIDAGGLVLAPGFIDIHSHTDSTLFRYPLLQSKIFQGVTVEVTGNCGLGVFPVVKGREADLADYLRMHDFSLPHEGFTWTDFASYAEVVDRVGLAIHMAPLVGHAPLRMAAMGMTNRAPAADELAQMKKLLNQALQQGAWGMSTGLIYPPGSFAETSEIMALVQTVASRNALYTSHIRGEGETLMEAMDEAIAIGRDSGARVQISHLKAMGKHNRGRASDALARIAAARSAGLDVAADQYPYTASGTALSALVPQWAHEGGVAELLQRLQAPELRERLLAEVAREMTAREGADRILVANCRTAANRTRSGQSIARIAEEWGCRPEEAVLRLLREEEAGIGAIFFTMSEEDVAAILADPIVAVGSDGQGYNADLASAESTHPRSYGTFPRVLGRYVRRQRVLSLEAAIRKMTGLPAARLGFADRGLVRVGFVADLVLFDPETIDDVADYATPHRYATGVIHLLVDGRPVLKDGALTGERPGRVLRRIQRNLLDE